MYLKPAARAVIKVGRGIERSVEMSIGRHNAAVKGTRGVLRLAGDSLGGRVFIRHSSRIVRKLDPVAKSADRLLISVHLGNPITAKISAFTGKFRENPKVIHDYLRSVANLVMPIFERV
ncbi:MAG: hypothetical protein FJZ00_08100 [Candidatus Sericytochromatia bacterium]|uniref:Uncharacterized protein n=1 Tax=Candidatus Tanganyikabacteria bacterium TaxID=2961651 RepID=A0A937X7M8_9BACT|nr:hypothetical protein [Candidatus Tanganyikabacteria bacterium]